MKKKQLKKNLFKRILIIIIVINFIIILILLSQLKNKKNIVTDEKTNTSNQINLEIIYPMGIYQLMQDYTGNVSENYIISRVENLIKYIAENSKNINEMTEEEIKTNYENNAKKISLIGIEGVENYTKLIKNLQGLQKDELIYKYCRIDIETIKDDGENTTADFYIKFENCNEIKFSMILINKYTANILALKLVPQT